MMPMSSPPSDCDPSSDNSDTSGDGPGLCFDFPVYPIQPFPSANGEDLWLPTPHHSSTIAFPSVDSEACSSQPKLQHRPCSTLCSPPQSVLKHRGTGECCAEGVDHRHPKPPEATATASSSFGCDRMRMAMRRGREELFGGGPGLDGNFAVRVSSSDEFPPLSQQQQHNPHHHHNSLLPASSLALLQSKAEELDGRQRDGGGFGVGTSIIDARYLGEEAVRAALHNHHPLNNSQRSTVEPYNCGSGGTSGRAQLPRTGPMTSLGWNSSAHSGSSASTGGLVNTWVASQHPVGQCCVNYAAAVVNSIGGLTDEKSTSMAARGERRRAAVPPLFPALNEPGANRLPPSNGPTPLRQLNFNTHHPTSVPQSSLASPFATSAPPPIARPAPGGTRAAVMAAYCPPPTASPCLPTSSSSTAPTLNGPLVATTTATGMNGRNGGQFNGNTSDTSSHCTMREVPLWLKSLRLHKYTAMFQAMGYQEMMALNDVQLEQRQVTKGARRKILQSLEKLRERVSLLLQLETCIDEGGDTRCLIYELRAMMNTPMCSQPTPSCMGDGDLPSHIFRILGRLHRYLFDPSAAASASALREVQSPEPAALEEDYLAKLFQVYDKCLQHEAFTAWQKDAMLGYKRALRRFAQERGMTPGCMGAARPGASSPNGGAGGSGSSTRTTSAAGYSGGAWLGGGGRGVMRANSSSSSSHRHQHFLLHKARPPQQHQQQRRPLNSATSTSQLRYNHNSYGEGRGLIHTQPSKFYLLRRRETSPSIVTTAGREVAALNIGSVPPSPPSTLPSSSSSTTNFAPGNGGNGPMSPPSAISSPSSAIPTAEQFAPPLAHRQPPICFCECAELRAPQQQKPPSHRFFPPPPGFPNQPSNYPSAFTAPGHGGTSSTRSSVETNQNSGACNGMGLQRDKSSQLAEIMRPYYALQGESRTGGDTQSSASRREKQGEGDASILFTSPSTMMSRQSCDDRRGWIEATEPSGLRSEPTPKVPGYTASVWPRTAEAAAAAITNQKDPFDLAWSSQRPPAPSNAPSTVRDQPPRVCSPSGLTVYKFEEESPLLLSSSPGGKLFSPKRDSCANNMAKSTDSGGDPTVIFSPLFVSFAPRTQWPSFFCSDAGGEGTSSGRDASSAATAAAVNSIWGVGAVH